MVSLNSEVEGERKGMLIIIKWERGPLQWICVLVHAIQDTSCPFAVVVICM